MSDQPQIQPGKPVATVEYVTELSTSDLNDLCDATDAAIEGGGGFGWVTLPARDVLERYWQGALAMPSRLVFVARLDGVICGTAQLITPPKNNEAQGFSVNLTTAFIAPWARGHQLGRQLIQAAEKKALEEGYSVINLDIRETLEAGIKLYESLGYAHVGTHPFYAQVDDKIIKGRYYYKVINSETLKKLSSN